MSGGRLISDTEVTLGGQLEGYGRITCLDRVGGQGSIKASGGHLIIDADVGTSGDVQIEAGAALSTRGGLDGQVTNAGTLASYGGNLALSGDTLTNSGLLTNDPLTSIFVRSTTLNHTGSIAAKAGGGISFDQGITNASGQTINLYGGNVAAPQVTNAAGGSISGLGTITANMVNQGTADFYGDTCVFGDVSNEVGATLGIRNGDLLIVGDTVNDGLIKLYNAEAYFEGTLTNNGEINMDPAVAVVAGDLAVAADGVIVADEGSELKLLASFDNRSTQKAGFHLEAATVRFSGFYAGGGIQQLEVAGVNLGASTDGYLDNFAFGTLVIEAAKLQLVDDFDNQQDGPNNEAAYVDWLVLNTGAAIDFNSLNLYFRNGGGPKQLFHGDANLDGCVDGLDYVTWSNNYLTGDTWGEGDCNGDGVADGLDYVLWSNNYRQGSPSLPGPVPEPGVVSLLTLGCVALVRRRRQ